LAAIAARSDIVRRLEDRVAVEPAVFNSWMETREKLHTVEGDYTLSGSTDPEHFFEKAFFLVERTADGKRKYQQQQ
jgi:hypothetical protein